MAKKLFTINGHVGGVESSLTWEDGEPSGDERAMRALRRLLSQDEPVHLGGQLISDRGEDHMANPLAVLIIFCKLLYPLRDSSGQVPEVPSVPDGAIA